MKSDPYTPPATTTQHASVEQHKSAWLEQCKGEWLDQARVEWEAGGKQLPWAEWSGEQEWRWTAELPHCDFEWTRRLAETQKGGDEPGRRAYSPGRITVTLASPTYGLGAD